jgi:hypothetical protein
VLLPNWMCCSLQDHRIISGESLVEKHFCMGKCNATLGTADKVAIKGIAGSYLGPSEDATMGTVPLSDLAYSVVLSRRVHLATVQT